MSLPSKQEQDDKPTEEIAGWGPQEMELEQAEDYNPIVKQSFRIAVRERAEVVNVG